MQFTAVKLWYVDTPKELLGTDSKKGHFISGIVKNEQEAILRARGTDELNAEDIRNKYWT
jgi:hypothetical protein